MAAFSSWKAFDLRRLLYAVVGGILVIIIAAFAVLAWGSAEQLVQPTVERQLSERSASAVSVIESAIQGAISEVELVALSPVIREAVVQGADLARRQGLDRLSVGELEERLVGTISLAVSPSADDYLQDVVSSVDFERVFATDRNGLVVASSGAVPNPVQSGTEWWREAFAGREAVFEVEADDASGRIALAVALRVRDVEGSALGVVRGVIGLENLQRSLSRLAHGWGYVQLIDEEGRLISDPQEHHLFERHPNEDILIHGRVVESSDWQGVPVIGMVRPALHSRWKVVYWVPQEQAYDLLYAAQGAIGYFVVIALLTALAGILTAGSWVSREISKPVKMVADAAGMVGGGDLRVGIQKVGKGEVRRLCFAVQEMVDRLRELVGSIREASYQAQSRSQEIAGAVDQLSTGAEEMTGTLSRLTAEAASHSDTIQEVNARMVSLGAAARDLANGAETATERSRQLRGIAEKSRERLRESQARVAQMAERSDLATSQLIQFMEASRQFSEFVDLIKQFARRTNLLALNAAIEAARAGGEARGFAVLAEEIRKLANQAGEAADRAQDTTDVVLGQLEATGQAIEETRETTQAVGSIVESLEESFERVTRAMGEAEGWSDRVSEVSADVDSSLRSTAERLNEVVSGFTDFAAAMEELAAGMEEQNASTEEIAGAVNALNTSAWELASLAEVFVVDTYIRIHDQEAHVADSEAQGEAPEVIAAAARV